MPLTEARRHESQTLFDTCNIPDAKLGMIDDIIGRMQDHQPTYMEIQNQLGIPWYVVGVIHQMESDMNFTTHLHNGDPLTDRTKKVPSGRPKTGNPPFTWEESALDSMQYEKLHEWSDWSVSGILYKLEAYNGWGYRSKDPKVNSPYLWSFSNHYTSGKFTSDGNFSYDAVSQQCGAAVIMKRMAETGIIDLPVSPVPAPSSAPNPVPDIPDVDLPIVYSNSVVPYAKELQNFLNTFPEIDLNPDGKPGKNTSAAVRKVLGFYLSGDPRV